MTATEKPVGVVLAGGRSIRMGRDKSLLPLGGRTLIELVARRLAPQVSRIIINSNQDGARFAALGLPVIADHVADYCGPLAGIAAGMQWVVKNMPGAAHILTIAVDTPFFPEDLGGRLGEAGASGAQIIAVPASGGRLHPTCGLYPCSLVGDLEQFLAAGGRRAHDWLARHEVAAVDFALLPGASGIDPFFNINTPQDHASAEVWLSEGIV